MQAFQRLRLEWSDGRILDIEVEGSTEGPAITDVPRIGSAVVRAYAAAEEPGIPALCWREDEDRLFEPLQLREQTDYLIDVVVPVPLSEARARSEASEAWPLSPRLSKFFHRDPARRWRDDADGTRVTGRLNFRSHAGLADLCVADGIALLVEVVPRKLQYHDDFRTLLTEVSRQLSELLLQIDAGTSSKVGLGTFDHVDPRALLFHLRRLMSRAELPQAIEHILHSGGRALRSREAMVPLHELEDVDAAQVATRVPEMEWQRGGALGRLFQGFTPSKVPRRDAFESADTPENGYVKAFLDSLLVELGSLQRRLVIDRLSRASKEVQVWTDQIAEWLSHPMWSEVRAQARVPTNSQLLQRGAGYRDVLSADLTLQYGVQLPWDRGTTLVEGLEAEIRPVDELYQYWCFFALRDVLRSICGQEGKHRGNLLRWSKGELRVNLRYGEKSRIDFDYRVGGRQQAIVALFYNRTFSRRASRQWYGSGSYSAEFRPDYSILFRPLGSESIGHWLHFDAKYRLDLKRWKAELKAPVEAGESGEPAATASRSRYRRENLDEMHAYRDALLGSRGSYLLYPGQGTDCDVFVRRPSTLDGPRNIPSVGAFQLRPSPARDQQTILSEFLREAFAVLASSSRYQEEEGFLVQATPTVLSE